MIEFKNITKSFKVDFWDKPFIALDNISFKIKEGVVTGFLGANGAGKTTSLKLLMNFIKADTGAINFSPELGKSTSEIFGNIGYLPERPYFYPYLTGREFIFYMGKINDLKPALIKVEIEKWTRKFEITHALDRKIRTYSKGMLQRLGFVSVLIHSPKLIILDEPLSGLDPVGRKEIKDVMSDIAASGKTIFFSSHIVSDVEEISQNVIVLEKGDLLYSGTIKELIAEKNDDQYNISGEINRELDSEIKNTFSSIEISDNSSYQITLNHTEKDSFVQKMVNHGHSIERIIKQEKTLEEIVYHIRS